MTEQIGIAHVQAVAGDQDDRGGTEKPVAVVQQELIEAGADLFLMPSRFEPCGLNQMYSLRYGTVPIVRRVGGLADTVVDYAGHVEDGAAATGFVFEPYTPDALLRTLRRALAVFDSSDQWRAIQRAGMARDDSWDRSAREYVKIYGRLTAKGEVNGGG